MKKEFILIKEEVNSYNEGAEQRAFDALISQEIPFIPEADCSERSIR